MAARQVLQSERSLINQRLLAINLASNLLGNKYSSKLDAIKKSIESQDTTLYYLIAKIELEISNVKTSGSGKS